MPTSSLSPPMSDKLLAWACKLPLSAANFVVSLQFFSHSNGKWLCGYLSFTLGLIYLFICSSMGTVLINGKLAPCIMAAIILGLVYTLLSLTYMLHKCITYYWRNSNSISQNYEDRHSRQITKPYHSFAIPFNVDWRVYDYYWGRKGYGDADSGARCLRRSSRPFLTDETSDLGERSAGKCFSVFVYTYSFPVTISSTIRQYMSCLCHAPSYLCDRLHSFARLCHDGVVERKLCHGGGRGSTFQASGLHGLSWWNALMLLRERWMRLFHYASSMGRLSI